MSVREIIQGVHVVQGKYAEEFGYISSYVVIDNDEAIIIDPGTAGDPGQVTIDSLEGFGINPKQDVKLILCTHGHPDHIGGAKRLRNATNAPLAIHRLDSGLLEDPKSFIKERLLLDFAERLAMKLERGPLKVNYKGIKPDRVLSGGEIFRVGKFSLEVIYTGGHSAGHCVIYDSSNRILFSGDEVNNFPNDARKFYVDLSGSIAARGAALDMIRKLNVDYLLPAHDLPHLFDDVDLQIEEAKQGIVHFQDTLLNHLNAREDADVEQLVFDIIQSRSVPVPMSMDGLLPTTVQVALTDLEKAGLVREEEDGIWRIV